SYIHRPHTHTHTHTPTHPPPHTHMLICTQSQMDTYTHPDTQMTHMIAYPHSQIHTLSSPLSLSLPLTYSTHTHTAIPPSQGSQSADSSLQDISFILKKKTGIN